MYHTQFLFIAHCYLRYPAEDLIAFPDGSEEYCQYIIPAYHLYWEYALATHYPSCPWSTHPVFAASAMLTGLPTTSFFYGTPLLIISWTDVPENTDPDCSNKVWYVSYFVLPWL